MSDEVMARLVPILGDPATCPHGNPIPGSANLARTQRPLLALANTEPVQKVRFERLGEEVELDGTTLRNLDHAGFKPGADAMVTDKGPDGRLLLDAGGTGIVLGADVCQRLYVTVPRRSGTRSSRQAASGDHAPAGTRSDPADTAAIPSVYLARERSLA